MCVCVCDTGGFRSRRKKTAPTARKFSLGSVFYLILTLGNLEHGTIHIPSLRFLPFVLFQRRFRDLMALGLNDERIHTMLPVVRPVVLPPCVQDALVLLDDPLVPFAPVCRGIRQRGAYVRWPRNSRNAIVSIETSI